MTTLFISDLHLEEKRPEIIEAFFTFLKQKALNIDALYILGDFFEAWIGDDENTPLQVSVKDRLKEVTESGTLLFIMHGNRDFLMGSLFCQETGAQLLNDPTVISLYDHSVLLMHGDSLCTQDVEYMKFRKNMRDPQWQTLFLQRSLPERQLVAQQLRTISQAKNKGKTQEIMDVTPAEVVGSMKEHAVDTLIHGHTHRPDTHEILVDGKPATRIVLGDWDTHVWFIQAEPNGEIELLKYPI
ncbi:UDP-2,3-diacylglucosamine diphosphatase [Alkalimarinus sediminis]|uniref:UDP-2,3-diacylglucosamine hydrolase n=1 Tax=Alkalimarinus sediminis TaxID=1632866 RepID=A0A9E8HPP5_9ALTE|nr:UDP-2,3-diacylglucosamine diphosphatase [Alkalimarinus sediminis]UZW76458.1 UDP-2,3-diacylglucosamine diphosphatase [Alkalimarinus sediminis]